MLCSRMSPNMLTNSRQESGARDASSAATKKQLPSHAGLCRPVWIWRGERVSSACFGRASATREAILRGLAAGLVASEHHEASP